MRALALLVPLPLLLGCLAEPSQTVGSEAEHRLHGTFTPEATQAELDAFAASMPEGAEVVFLESFPPQFVVSNVGRTGCEEARDFAQRQAYVQSVGKCQPATRSDDPDRPTSSG